MHRRLLLLASLLLLQWAGGQIDVDVPSLWTKVPLNAVAGIRISDDDHVVANASVQQRIHQDSGEQFDGTAGGWF